VLSKLPITGVSYVPFLAESPDVSRGLLWCSIEGVEVATLHMTPVGTFPALLRRLLSLVWRSHPPPSIAPTGDLPLIFLP
jgi:hypothetical protein